MLQIPRHSNPKPHAKKKTRATQKDLKQQTTHQKGKDEHTETAPPTPSQRITVLIMGRVAVPGSPLTLVQLDQSFLQGFAGVKDFAGLKF